MMRKGAASCAFTLLAFVLSAAWALAEPLEHDPPRQAPGPPEATALPAAPAAALGVPRDTGIGWDLNLEGAAGAVLGGSGRGSTMLGIGRARGGLLIANDPMYFALGGTFETSRLSPATFGVQAEVLSIGSGLWLQAGGLLDARGDLGAMGSAGWSILGIEYQYRTFENLGTVSAIYAKLRLPIGLLYRAATAP